jgi:electron transfer flavoprotein alpha/beta subunit
MNIVACLKTVADPDIAVFDVVKDELTDLYPVMDPVGYQVLEVGLQLRETKGGQLTAVCLGDATAEPILRYALHQGADAAIRFFSGGLPETDTWARARAIAKGLSDIPYDLILTGAASADSGSSYMPASLAAHLKIPFSTHTVDVRKDRSEGLTVVKKLPHGNRETYRLELPAIVGCAPGIHVPRYVAPFSRAYRRGEEKSVQTVTAEPAPEQAVSLTCIIRVTASKPRVKGGINITALSPADRLKMMRGESGTKKEIFTGSANEAARKIMDHAQLGSIYK